MTLRVVIAQPYVPKYRVAFFEGLQHRLSETGVDCVVAAGLPRGAQAARNDAVKPDWLVPMEIKNVSIGHKSIDININPAPWKRTDAVILGLEGSSLPVYQALLSSKLSGTRVGLWGHVRPYVAAGNSIDLWLEQRQMRAADHVFAYTTGGRNYAVQAGIKPSKVTTVMNSVDTSMLERSKENVTTASVQSFGDHYGIDLKKTLCFVGGLDASKRIKFLTEVLEVLWQEDKTVRLIVGGEGPEKWMLKPAFDRGQAIDLGYLNGSDKALVMTASRGVMMPGRIGLVAVDALVTGCPIVTTDWPYHAPEAEYLTEGTSRITAQNDVQRYASKILEYLSSEPIVHNFAYPKIGDMVENFAQGVEKMLAY